MSRLHTFRLSVAHGYDEWNLRPRQDNVVVDCPTFRLVG